MTWGKRKDGQAYNKDKKGISGTKIKTNPTSDVHFSKKPDMAKNDIKNFILRGNTKKPIEMKTSVEAVLDDEEKIEKMTEGEGLLHNAILIETKDGSEYLYFQDEDAARSEAIERVTQDLENEPSIFNQDWLQGFVDKDHLRDELKSDVEDMIRDDIIDDPDHKEHYGITDKDIDNDSNKFMKVIEKTANERLENPIQYLRDIYGDNDGLTEAMKIGGIDIKNAAIAAIDEDGIAHFLSGYDGKERHTEDGGLVYRTN